MKVVGSAIFISREKTGGCTTWGDYQLVNIPQLSPIVPLPAVERGRGTGTEGELGVHGHGIRGGNPESTDTESVVGIRGRGESVAGWDVEPAIPLVLPSASGTRSGSAALTWNLALGSSHEPAILQ